MEEKKQKILETVRGLILKYGIKSMTMDDIARELGMSKKTLYQYFKDKNDLIMQVMQFDIYDHEQIITSLQKQKLNAIEESLEMFKQILADFSEIQPNILFDLKKYHPEAFNLYEEFKRTYMYQCIEANLQKGIKEGFYRKDIDTAVITINYIVMVSNLFENPESFGKNRGFLILYEQIFRYHINGIASNKGRQYLADNYASMNFNH